MLLLLSASFDFCTKGKRTGEREREMNKNSRLSLYSLRFFLFRAIEKNTPRQLWIPDELQIELNRHRVNTFTYLLRLFTRRFSKGSAHLFFSLFLSLFLSCDHGWILKNYEVEENRDSGEGRGISIFTESVRISLQIVLLPCFRIITMNSYAVEWSVEWTNIGPMTKD